jgi:hypothetical protein
LRHSNGRRTSAGIYRGYRKHTSADQLAFTAAANALVVDTRQAGELALWGCRAALQLRIATLLGCADVIDKDKRSLAGCVCKQNDGLCSMHTNTAWISSHSAFHEGKTPNATQLIRFAGHTVAGGLSRITALQALASNRSKTSPALDCTRLCTALVPHSVRRHI